MGVVLYRNTFVQHLHTQATTNAQETAVSKPPHRLHKRRKLFCAAASVPSTAPQDHGPAFYIRKVCVYDSISKVAGNVTNHSMHLQAGVLPIKECDNVIQQPARVQNVNMEGGSAV